MVPQSFSFSNARWFGSQRISYDLSGHGILLYHPAGVRGTSVVVKLFKTLLYQGAVSADLFHDPGQPLMTEISYSDGSDRYKLENIYYFIKDQIQCDRNLYEWKTASECFVPVDFPGGKEKIDEILNKISATVNIIEAGSLRNVTSQDLIQWPDLTASDGTRVHERCSSFQKHLHDLKRFYTENENIFLSSEQADLGMIRYDSPVKTTFDGNGSADGQSLSLPEMQSSSSISENQLHEKIIRYAELYLTMNFTDRLIDAWKDRFGEDPGEAWHDIIRLFGELSQLEERRQQHEDLLAGINQIERVVAKLEDEMKLDLHTGMTQMNEKRPWVSKLHEYEKELELHHRELVKLQKIQDKQKHILEQGLLDKTKLEFLERWIEEHKVYVEREKEAIESVNQSVCPDCRRTMDDGPSSHLKKQIQERMESINGRIFQYQIEVDEIRHAMEKLRESYAELEKELKQQPAVWHQYYTTENRLQIARQYDREYHTLKEHTDRIKQNLATRAFARRELQALDDMQKQLQKTAFQPSKLRAVRQEIQDRLTQQSESILSLGLLNERKRLESGRKKYYQDLLHVKNEIREVTRKFPSSDSAVYENMFDSMDVRQFLQNLTAGFIKDAIPEKCAQCTETEKHKLLILLDQLIGITDEFKTYGFDQVHNPEEHDSEGLSNKILHCRIRMTESIYNYFSEESDLTLSVEFNPGQSCGIVIHQSGCCVSWNSLAENDARVLAFALQCSDLILQYCLFGMSRPSLWIELPFLLHGNDFISKIRAVVNDVMFWVHRAIILSPHNRMNTANAGFKC